MDPTSQEDSLLNLKSNPNIKTLHVYRSIDTDLGMNCCLFNDRMQFWDDILGPHVKPTSQLHRYRYGPAATSNCGTSDEFTDVTFVEAVLPHLGDSTAFMCLIHLYLVFYKNSEPRGSQHKLARL
jgi:hypothetical protein